MKTHPMVAPFPDRMEVASRRTPGMALVPSGSFTRGSDVGSESEHPVRSIYLDTFEIDETPVTNAAFRHFAESAAYVTLAERLGRGWGFDGEQFRDIDGLCWRNAATPDRDDHPVVYVAWEDAVRFAEWAGRRLPTEAEWEKAARAGMEDRAFPWGDEFPDRLRCNWSSAPAIVPPTKAVSAFPPNGLGIYDMVGNVWQWCSDWFDENYYGAVESSIRPSGPSSGVSRVRRGGSWNVIQPFRLRCANRGAVDPAMIAPNMGFRCAKSVSGSASGHHDERSL